MSVAAGITRMGRVRAEALMESVCTITRAGATTVDPATGENVPSSTTVYSGPCRVKQADTQVSQVAAAGQLLISQGSVLSLPVASSGGVREGDVATVTVSPLDAALVGVRFRIEGSHAQSFATARRFPVEQVS